MHAQKYFSPIHLVEWLQIKDYRGHDCRIRGVLAILGTNLHSLSSREGKLSPLLTIFSWPQLEKWQGAPHSLVFGVHSLLSLFGSINSSLNLSGYYCSWECTIENTTSIACPVCLDLMWCAMPELEVSLAVQPTLPLRTIWSQWRHLASRKSPEQVVSSDNTFNGL